MPRELLSIDESELAATADHAAVPDDIILHSSQERPALFAILVERYQAPFLRLAQRVVNDRGEAEDVVQEAFVKIYRYAKRFQRGEDRKFSSWAYKIVLNTSITHYHKLKKRDWLLPEEGDPTAGEAHVRFREASRDRETEAVVRSVLGVLPQDIRDLLTTYYLEDKSYRTIAAESGMTMGTLKMKLFRARRLFRERLLESKPE